MALHTVWKLTSLFLVCCYLPRLSLIFVFFRPAPSFPFPLLSLAHTVDSDPAVCVISFLASVSSRSKLPDGCLYRDMSAREFRWFLGLKAFPSSLFISVLLNLSFAVCLSASHSSSQQRHTCKLHLSGSSWCFSSVVSKVTLFTAIDTGLHSPLTVFILVSKLQLFYYWLIFFF